MRPLHWWLEAIWGKAGILPWDCTWEREEICLLQSQHGTLLPIPALHLLPEKPQILLGGFYLLPRLGWEHTELLHIFPGISIHSYRSPWKRLDQLQNDAYTNPSDGVSGACHVPGAVLSILQPLSFDPCDNSTMAAYR